MTHHFLLKRQQQYAKVVFFYLTAASSFFDYNKWHPKRFSGTCGVGWGCWLLPVCFDEISFFIWGSKEFKSFALQVATPGFATQKTALLRLATKLESCSWFVCVCVAAWQLTAVRVAYALIFNNATSPTNSTLSSLDCLVFAFTWWQQRLWPSSHGDCSLRRYVCL